MESRRAGQVIGLWRYPVKSLRGERRDTLHVEARGVAGDRLYAVRTPEGKLGSGKSSRRFRRLAGRGLKHVMVVQRYPVEDEALERRFERTQQRFAAARALLH